MCNGASLEKKCSKSVEKWFGGIFVEAAAAVQSIAGKDCVAIEFYGSSVAERSTGSSMYYVGPNLATLF